MVSTILGRKLGMTQIFDEDDNFVPVTVILAGPCTVSQVKTKETDGYEAVQIGFGALKPKHVNKPMAGHFAKAGVEPMKYLREVRVDDASQYSCGDKVTVEAFADVKAVDVTGTSKGKGFQGTVKRWNFSPRSYGSWFPQPARAGLHRPVRLSCPCPQGSPHGRPHGR
jgi:large subunit ribosomal protein L3